MNIPFDELNNVDLVKYIKTYYKKLKLRKSGRVYKCLCPFHEEKSGSLVIFPNNTFKCFGCGEYGTPINFVMKMENLELREACKLLGDNTDIKVELEKPNPYHEAYKDKMTEHANRYHEHLLLDSKAMHYLKDVRGLNDDTIKLFNIGLVPNNEYQIRNDIGGIAGRLSFPIYEHKDYKYAKCIAMGYRVLDENYKGPTKYKNDVNQEGREAEEGVPAQDKRLEGVFIKSKTLFGYHIAARSVRKIGYVIIVEGYMDVASMNQAKVHNVMAPMGTSFTDEQMDMLKNLTDNILIFLDGDDAGINSMFKAIPKLYAKGFNVQMIINKSGVDPADICKKYDFDNKKINNFMLANGKPAMNVIINQEIDRYETFVTKERIKVLTKLEEMFKSVPDSPVKSVMKDTIYKKLEMK